LVKIIILVPLKIHAKLDLKRNMINKSKKIERSMSIMSIKFLLG